jgi:pyridoxamine 5'-phosphate oxidase
MILPDEAVRRFREVFDLARADAVPEHNAMTLATARADGRPSARTVLLKAMDEQGFVFYTNKQSRKGEQMLANAHAALCFHWAPLGRQVLVEGSVEPVSDEESDAYFASRPRLSQIGAWASRQSQPLDGPEQLEAQVKDVEVRFEGQKVPRPPHWGGFRVRPRMIEFWTSREGRLHVRDRYEMDDSDRWSHIYLNP